MPIISPARVAHWVVDVVDLSWLCVTKDLGPYLALWDQRSSFFCSTRRRRKKRLDVIERRGQSKRGDIDDTFIIFCDSMECRTKVNSGITRNCLNVVP